MSQPHRRSEERDGLIRRPPPRLSRDKKVRGEGELIAHIDRGSDANVDDDVVLDISAILIGADNRIPFGDDRYCVFYNARLSTDQSTRYVDDGDAGEHINVNLRAVDQAVSKIVFTVSIYDADDLNYTFGSISEAHFWIEGPLVGGEGEKEEVFSDNLSKHFPDASALVVGELHRSGDGWKYLRLGHTYPGLAEIGTLYGVTFS